MTSPAPAQARDSAWWWLILVALATGAFLRLWQLGEQIPVDDEWHAVHKAFSTGMADIATHFGGADYSIPLALYDRLLYQLGWLSEWPLRLPSLIAGLLLLLAPLALRRLPLATRASWIGLLAVSPVLVYLSRIARPYALVCLLAGFAVLAFSRWWAGGPGARRWAAAYVLATALAAWLHLLSLAFTLAPFLWFGVIALRRSLRGRIARPLLRMVAIGCATLALLLALLLPPLLGDWTTLAAKASLGQLDWASAGRTLLMALGSARLEVALPMLALGAWGARVLAREHGRLLACLGFVAILGVLLVILPQPAWIQHPPVFMRYVIPVLPFLLLLVAAGLADLLARMPLRAAALAAGAGVLGLLVAAGPLPAQLHRPNQFSNDGYFQFDPDLAHTERVFGLENVHVPEFYRELATEPPASLVLAEGPWRLESDRNPLPWYQGVDRQWRRIAMTYPLCSRHEWGEYGPQRHGIRLHQFVRLEDILAGRHAGIDFLVLHLQPWTQVQPDDGEWPDMEACLARVSAALGEPAYHDADIAAFDLRTNRQASP